jgi:hypothetical protein
MSYSPDIVKDIGSDIIKLMMVLVQDCISGCVVAPYPFRIEPLEDLYRIGDLNVILKRSWSSRQRRVWQYGLEWPWNAEGEVSVNLPPDHFILD